jgi:hypothetical protein
MVTRLDIEVEDLEAVDAHAVAVGATLAGYQPQDDVQVYTGARLAEAGFGLIFLVGIWLAATQIPKLRSATALTVIAGITLALAGLLLEVATHWGHFG